MTLTYVYCLVRSARRPSLRDAPAGVAGSSGLRALGAGNRCWVIAAQVPAEQYGEAALAQHLGDLEWVAPHAMAHEAMVERFLGAPAVVPMPLMTLFTSEERAVTHLARDRRRLERLLDRIERRLEWGLRLTFDPRAAEPSRRHTAVPQTGTRASRTGSPSGVEYLSRKRDQLDGDARLLRTARTEGNRLYRALAREASDAKRRRATERAAPGSRLLVDAAFLVPVARTRSFQTTLRRHAKDLGASGLVVSLTGPWPPYHFVGSRTRGVRS